MDLAADQLHDNTLAAFYLSTDWAARYTSSGINPDARFAADTVRRYHAVLTGAQPKDAAQLIVVVELCVKVCEAVRITSAAKDASPENSVDELDDMTAAATGMVKDLKVLNGRLENQFKTRLEASAALRQMAADFAGPPSGLTGNFTPIDLAHGLVQAGITFQSAGGITTASNALER